ncbi:MAG TPA: bifunctional [glutamine synthetase] adenylyltransferase/[glutamine synthetase]-adenylyl-L-tyrosine phosphorylase, partial [Actinomycetes bacterium]|nr:bifunctional [glutamine synthetase] adenylyltransferase/[glutamine synthetase]-adenylyl-L-tyrosine phosphorylase [Actinomycetes bacterium]
RLLEARPSGDVAAAMAADDDLRARLSAVLGTSAALADHLARHPDDWRLLADPEATASRPTEAGLRRGLLQAVGADPEAATPVASGSHGAVLDALRVAYRRRLLVLAARDLAEGLTVDDVAAELADLAAAALDAALAVARAELGPEVEPVRLAILGLGKCGGRELNYVSDVDVIYVGEPLAGGDEGAALRTAVRLAAAIARVCTTTTAEGALWEVDAGLRPEGSAGPLVRSLASHTAYYRRWAKTWEFQALLKARPVAGDRVLGAEYVAAVQPFVWEAAAREDFVVDVQAMRRRVEEHIPAGQADRQLKLGPGGLRDVEFSVQLLQLVHGRSDESLRSPHTLTALAALSDGGYVGREDAASLSDAYRFLRTLEHRIQLHRLRRTHLVPSDERDLRRIGRSVGFRSDPVAELTHTWRRHAREVRRLHEKLFYRPLLQAVARLEPGQARLTPEAATARLEALGYDDPAGALRHLEALTSGVSRRAAIQRTLLPVMLGWFADSADPDAGLLGFRRVSEALGTTHWYLALLRDAGAAAERLARILGSSRYATDLLLRAPDAVAMLASDDDLRPLAADELASEVAASVGRSVDPESAAVAVRAIRRRELFRVSAADVLGLLDVDEVASALTDVAAAAVAGGLQAATRAVEQELGSELPTAIAIVAMGRFGGRELGYGSDVDVLFVHEPSPGADEKDATDAAHAVANELRRLLALPAPDPPLLVDADLRPEGRQGPLVRTLASYAAYYERWSLVWESQALLRAEPAAGDAALGARFVTLVDPLRYPRNGLARDDVREIRRLKSRVEAERLPRGADPATHTKLGRGGLSDVEWTVQLLQLQHAARVPGLRTTSTLAALESAADEQLIDAQDAETLAAAWRLATKVRNAIVLVRGRADDSLPKDQRDLAGVARLVAGGGATGGSGAASLVEEYRRATRRARGVVDRVFYG